MIDIRQAVIAASAAIFTMSAIAQDKAETANPPPIRLDNVSELSSIGTIDKHVWRMVFGPNKGQISLIGWETALDVLDASTFKPIKQLAVDKKLTGIAFSADGNLFAWSDNSKSVQIRDLRTNKAIDIDAGGPRSSLAFSPNGKFLATGVYGTEAKLWNVATGELVRSFGMGAQPGAIRTVFSPNGQRIAVGNRNAETRVFEVASGETVCTLPKMQTHEVKFGPDGKTLAIAYVDGSVALWEVPDGILVRSRQTAAEEIYSLDWSPNGSILVTAGLRGKITLWDARDLSVLKELEAPEWVIQARFSPDGSRLFTAGGTQLPSPNRKVTVWGIDPGAGK